MPLNIRSEEVNRLAEKVAALAKVSKTEAVRMALAHEAERLERRPSLRERLRPIQNTLDGHPGTGLKADKAFYDSLHQGKADGPRRLSDRRGRALNETGRSGARALGGAGNP